jgi:hypothetical protein
VPEPDSGPPAVERPITKPIFYDVRISKPAQIAGGVINGAIRGYVPPLAAFRPPPPSPEYAHWERGTEMFVGTLLMARGLAGLAHGGGGLPPGPTAVVTAEGQAFLDLMKGANANVAMSLQTVHAQASGPAGEQPPKAPPPSSSAPQRIPGSTDEEHAIDNYLRSQGQSVEPNAQEGAQGAGRQGDRLVNGILSEYKSLSGVKDTTPDGLSAAISRRVMSGRGQAPNVIVDTRAQVGMTQEIAERGVRRAYGADNATAAAASRGPLQSIRGIGHGFDITIPRR